MVTGIEVSDITYPKIRPIWRRACDGNGAVGKQEFGEFADQAVHLLKDVNWIWTEKVDGMNMRAVWDGVRPSFYGRSNRANIPGDLLEFMQGHFTEDRFETVFGSKKVVMFGEGYGAGIQNGGYYRTNKAFIGFDILIEGVWLDSLDISSIFASFGVHTVPVVYKGNVWNAIDRFAKDPVSQVAEKYYNAEGIVGVPVMGLFDKWGIRLQTKVKQCNVFANSDLNSTIY